MGNKNDSAAYQFAVEMLSDLKFGKLHKDCMMNRFGEFTSGLEELHRERLCSYLNSCGCFLMNRRLADLEEGYHG